MRVHGRRAVSLAVSERLASTVLTGRALFNRVGIGKFVIYKFLFNRLPKMKRAKKNRHTFSWLSYTWISLCYLYKAW